MVILFVHGFTGNENTWVNKNGKSFINLLNEVDEIKENYDIATVNYYSKLADFYVTRTGKSLVSRIFGLSSEVVPKNLDIDKLSEYLRSVINTNCNGYKKIVFIAHSMGGLVVKNYILKELVENQYCKVELFLSLAVPHNGSDWATLGKKLINKNRQVLDLAPLSNFLTDLNNRLIQTNNLPDVIYYYGQFDEVVSETSAIAYQTQKIEKFACYDDHFSITKPEPDSLHFIHIKDKLISLSKKIKLGMKTKFIDDGKLDNELFVLKLIIADVHQRLVNNAKKTFFSAEYVQRSLISQGIDISDLEELYKRIEHLYDNYFSKFLDGEIKSSSELVRSYKRSDIGKGQRFSKMFLTND